ncbi:uncharacterized protein [Nerophis lumbriciformis]|uniref:uncharacterized protein isoform X3 n=1 Tax=Nerophis lumbriciformis TaxID=546530 RepID=UPI002AE0117A|nr:uncharacterized protein LOC133610766 isoform X3 [Nerophis lumbriciformis]
MQTFFLYQCSLVFAQQPHTYTTDSARVAYILSLLAGRAASWAMEVCESKPGLRSSLPLFSAELRSVFDHPVREREAGSRLLATRQGSSSVADHSISFRILGAESGWGERAFRGVFLASLSSQIQDELAAHDETQTLEELISLAIRLDNRLRERHAQKGVDPPSTRWQSSTWSTRSTSKPQVSSLPPSDCSAPEEGLEGSIPMQLGGSRLSSAERSRRLRLRLCLYCGAADHVVVRCPARPTGGRSMSTRDLPQGRLPTSPPAPVVTSASSLVGRLQVEEQYHLNNSAHGQFGPGLPHSHSNHSTVGLNKYTSLKAVADSASHPYYKSFPLMDFAHYQAPQAFHPVPVQPKEKSYIHQHLPSQTNLHAPLSISIPPSHLEHPHLPKTTTHPLLSSSTFKTWEPTGRHVQRQISAPGSASMHASHWRHGYSTRRQQSIENMPDVFNQPYGMVYAGSMAGHGAHFHVQHPPQAPYYHQTRQKSYSTHSATEVTV